VLVHRCPACGEKLPLFSIPSAETWWSGGWWCTHCGALISRSGKIKKAPSKKVCPRCAEYVQMAALVCRYCGYEFKK